VGPQHPQSPQYPIATIVAPPHYPPQALTDRTYDNEKMARYLQMKEQYLTTVCRIFALQAIVDRNASNYATLCMLICYAEHVMLYNYQTPNTLVYAIL
jgi:hypothetical protein